MLVDFSFPPSKYVAHCAKIYHNFVTLRVANKAIVTCESKYEIRAALDFSRNGTVISISCGLKIKIELVKEH